VKRKLDYEEYGGAPLLGVRGGIVICHGSSGERAIKNWIRAAGSLARFEVDEEIARSIASRGYVAGGAAEP
jgi:glycerol-3-phosphate acyltransferase PlsX